MPPEHAPAVALDAPPDQPPAVAPHRLDLARALAGAVVASLGAGDTAGARVALDALRGLVDASEPGAAERADTAAPTSGGAPVVSLATERRRRER